MVGVGMWLKNGIANLYQQFVTLSRTDNEIFTERYALHSPLLSKVHQHNKDALGEFPATAGTGPQRSGQSVLGVWAGALSLIASHQRHTTLTPAYTSMHHCIHFAVNDHEQLKVDFKPDSPIITNPPPHIVLVGQSTSNDFKTI